jgi:Bacterial membrane protein YfhO
MMDKPGANDKLIDFDRGDACVLAGLILLAVIILSPMLFADAGMAPGLPGHDGRTQWLPWKVYTTTWMKQGVVPLWNPHTLCGTPFVGNAQSALFYPPNMVYLVFPVQIAARLFYLFHIALSLIFTYLLAKSFCRMRSGAAVAAIVFAFGASQLLRVPAGHWGVSGAIPWMPLIFLCVEAFWRKPGGIPLAIGGIAVAFQLLSGVPQYAFITGLAIGAFYLIRTVKDGLTWRQRGARWGGIALIFILGASIAGIQLLPGIEAARNGARSLPMVKAWVELFSLPPQMLRTFLVPSFYGGVGGLPYFWEIIAYAGVLTLPLAVMGTMVRGNRRAGLRWVVMALAMLLLAFGKHTPLMQLLHALPMSGMFRGSAKFLLPCHLALAMAAAIGLSAVMRDGGRRWKVMVGLLVASAVVVFIICMESIPATAPESLGAIRKNAGLIAIALLGLAGVFCMMCNLRLKQSALFGGAVVALVALDMLWFGLSFVSEHAMFPVAEAEWSREKGDMLSASGNHGRVLILGDRNMNDGMMGNALSVEGYEPNPPLRFHRLYQELHGQPENIAPSTYQFHVNKPRVWDYVRNRMGLKRVYVASDSALRLPGLNPFARGDGWQALNVIGGRPRAFVAYSAKVIQPRAKPSEVLAMADGYQQVLIEGDDAGRRYVSNRKPSAAKIVEEGPNHVVIEATAHAVGWLVFLDNFYPGWKAYVDGAEVEILPANYAFRGVPLSPGIHRIIFRYEPLSLRLGFWLSLCGIVAAGVLAVRAWWLQRTNPDALPMRDGPEL